MTWVWQHSQSRKNERLVLLAIADCASDDGANAYPSMAELCRKTGLSERGVQRSLSSLVELGELFVGRNMGPRGCNRYRVVMRDPADSAPPPNLHPADSAVGQTDEVAQAGDGTPPKRRPVKSAPRRNAAPQKTTPAPAKSAPGTALEPSVKNSPSESPSPNKRGTRIPADFTVTDPMREWAYREAADVLGRDPDRPKLDVWLDRWTAEFIDYWTARSGAGATKANWVATWRNRVRAKLEQAAQHAPGNAVATRPKPSTTDERVAAALALKAKLRGNS